MPRPSTPIQILFFFLTVVCLMGCPPAPEMRPTARAAVFQHGPFTPAAAAARSAARAASVNPEAVSLRVLEYLAAAAFVVAVGLYFFLPATHRISGALAGASATVAVASCVARLSLWALPWFAAVLVALATSALVAFVAEVVLRVRAAKPTTALQCLDDVPAAVAKTVVSIEQIKVAA
jgi:hypothetical protein